MMDKLERVLTHGHKLLDNRGSILSLWQTIADHFYPERATFTTIRNEGEEFGTHLYSSYPVMVRRDLGDSMSSMLRPTSKNWFHIRTKGDWGKVGVEARQWLEWAENVQRKAMYNRDSYFVNAAKQGDHDFTTFGQAILQLTLNNDASGLLYRCWHLRDVAWDVNANMRIDTIYRKWTPRLVDLAEMFPGKLHPSLEERLRKNPMETTTVWHVIVPASRYELNKKHSRKFVSLYVDVANRHVMEEIALDHHGYIIPRWRTISDSVYAVSPATCVALPDARLLQAMVGVLLEAGEKAVNPPMVAKKNVFGGNFAYYPGGLTWADYADGRISDHFQQMPVDKNGIPLGMDMADRIQNQLTQAFYLNKLSLPPAGVDMTAYEVGQRVQEYIRQAMPLFEPMEEEYNGPLCESTFELLLKTGAFGSPFDMPKELHGADIEFTFESPLHDAVERAKGQNFLEAKSMLAEVVAIDPTAIHVMDIKAAFRDVLTAIGTPAAWLHSESQTQALVDAEEQARQTQELLAQMQMGADVAKTMGDTVTPPETGYLSG